MGEAVCEGGSSVLVRFLLLGLEVRMVQTMEGRLARQGAFFGPPSIAPHSTVWEGTLLVHAPQNGG